MPNYNISVFSNSKHYIHYKTDKITDWTLGKGYI